MATFDKKERMSALLRDLRYKHKRDPLDEIINIIDTGDIKDSEKLRAWMELNNFIFPKMKAIEVKPDMGKVLALNIDLTAAVKEAEEERDATSVQGE